MRQAAENKQKWKKQKQKTFSKGRESGEVKY